MRSGREERPTLPTRLKLGCSCGNRAATVWPSPSVQSWGLQVQRPWSLRLDVAAEIRGHLPGFPLVMHGSSSVPQEEVARIGAARGGLGARQAVDERSS